jgi:hypothetical protein
MPCDRPAQSLPASTLGGFYDFRLVPHKGKPESVLAVALGLWNTGGNARGRP